MKYNVNLSLGQDGLTILKHRVTCVVITAFVPGDADYEYSIYSDVIDGEYRLVDRRAGFVNGEAAFLGAKRKIFNDLMDKSLCHLTIAPTPDMYERDNHPSMDDPDLYNAIKGEGP